MFTKGVVFIVAAALLVAGCTGGPNQVAAMSAETPTAAAMMSESASATPEAMMNEVTPTSEAMMSNTASTQPAMMNEITPTTEAMMSNSTPASENSMATSVPAMMSEATTTVSGMMEGGTATPEMMSNSTPAGAMMGSQVFSGPLMDVVSGQSVQMGNYAGKVVLVSLFSTSCADCVQQQKNLESLSMERMNGLVVMTLDVDPNDNANMLASFAKQNNYHWVFANSNQTINHALSMVSNNPPAGQLLVIDRMGDVHALASGLNSPSDLSQALATYLTAK